MSNHEIIGTFIPDFVSKSYVNEINDPEKYPAHALRQAACNTIAMQEIPQDGIVPLPTLETPVTDITLEYLKLRLVGFLGAFQTLNDHLIQTPDPDSPLEQYLAEYFVNTSEAFLAEVRKRTVKVLNNELSNSAYHSPSHLIINPYLRLMRDTLREDDRNPYLRDIQELAVNSTEIVTRPALGLTNDFQAFIKTFVHADAFNTGDFILLKEINRITYSQAGKTKLNMLHLSQRRQPGVTGCPAMPNLIPLLIKKVVGK